MRTANLLLSPCQARALHGALARNYEFENRLVRGIASIGRIEPSDAQGALGLSSLLADRIGKLLDGGTLTVDREDALKLCEVATNGFASLKLPAAEKAALPEVAQAILNQFPDIQLPDPRRYTVESF